MGEALDGRVDIGTVTLASGLGDMDFRFPDYDFRATHPAVAGCFAGFAGRHAIKATAAPA